MEAMARTAIARARANRLVPRGAFSSWKRSREIADNKKRAAVVGFIATRPGIRLLRAGELITQPEVTRQAMKMTIIDAMIASRLSRMLMAVCSSVSVGGDG